MNGLTDNYMVVPIINGGTFRWGVREKPYETVDGMVRPPILAKFSHKHHANFFADALGNEGRS
jgi:hypothetical protein